MREHVPCELRLDEGYDLLISEILDVDGVVGGIPVVVRRLRNNDPLLPDQCTGINAGVNSRKHTLQGFITLGLADGHERPKGMSEVLFEGVSRYGLLSHFRGRECL